MSCEHEVRFTIKPTDDACRFHFDVRAYKDRIVAPDEYSGATEVTPSDETQTLETRDKLVRSDITVNPAPTESLATNENGTFVPSSGNVGFSEVVVDVEPSLESLSVTENGLYLPESGTDGFDRVTVSVPETIPDLVPLTATENGQYVPTGHDGYSQVNVAVPAPEPVLQGKAVNPSETAQHITADSGYDGLSAVDVGAIPSSYVGSGVTRRSSSDLSASGNTVNVPSGYYAESRSKSVQSGTAGTPTASKGAVSNHSIAVTPSVSNSEGYISGGTLTGNAITVSASELVSGTKQVSITANGTTTEDVTAYASAQISVNVVNQDYVNALTALGVQSDLADSIEALTTYANGVTGESDTTLSDAVASLADGYGQSGGVNVTRGMVFTAFDANDNPTAVDIYGDVLPYAIGYYNNSNGFGKYITSVTFYGNPVKIGSGAFQKTAITTLDIPDSVDSIGSQILRSNTAIAHYKHENARDLYGYGKPGVTALNFAPTANLVDIQLGAVGKTVTALYKGAFTSMINASTNTFTLYVYTTGDKVDSFLSSVRENLPCQTIVFKASEVTTYNDTEYAAGDTILTSTPT